MSVAPERVLPYSVSPAGMSLGRVSAGILTAVLGVTWMHLLCAVVAVFFQWITAGVGHLSECSIVLVPLTGFVSARMMIAMLRGVWARRLGALITAFVLCLICTILTAISAGILTVEAGQHFSLLNAMQSMTSLALFAGNVVLFVQIVLMLPRRNIEEAATRNSVLFLHYLEDVHLTAAVGIIPLVLMLFVVPRFQEVFKDFRTELPYLTQTIFVASRWMQDYPLGFQVMVCLSFLVPAPMLAYRLARAPGIELPRRSSRPWLLAIFAGFLVFLYFAAALGMPFIKLLESVTGGESGGR